LRRLHLTAVALGDHLLAGLADLGLARLEDGGSAATEQALRRLRDAGVDTAAEQLVLRLRGGGTLHDESAATIRQIVSAAPGGAVAEALALTASAELPDTRNLPHGVTPAEVLFLPPAVAGPLTEVLGRDSRPWLRQLVRDLAREGLCAPGAAAALRAIRRNFVYPDHRPLPTLAPARPFDDVPVETAAEFAVTAGWLGQWVEAADELLADRLRGTRRALSRLSERSWIDVLRVAGPPGTALPRSRQALRVAAAGLSSRRSWVTWLVVDAAAWARIDGPMSNTTAFAADVAADLLLPAARRWATPDRFALLMGLTELSPDRARARLAALVPGGLQTRDGVWLAGWARKHGLT
jgi:hypothetical protein